ncbi:hypothetical protein DSM21852_00170 [Methylocystis bryophila]|nr:hypothetical protein DSM21852_00170 [Methylocystis bryophila]
MPALSMTTGVLEFGAPPDQFAGLNQSPVPSIQVTAKAGAGSNAVIAKPDNAEVDLSHRLCARRISSIRKSNEWAMEQLRFYSSVTGGGGPGISCRST